MTRFLAGLTLLGAGACAPDLADHLRDTTAPDERVFVWGFDPTVNVRAQRRTTSRFLYNYPFRVDWGNTDYERELMDALRADPPRVVVVAACDITYGITGTRRDSWWYFRHLAPLRAFVEEGYTLETTVGKGQRYLPNGQKTRAPRYRVYRRND